MLSLNYLIFSYIFISLMILILSFLVKRQYLIPVIFVNICFFVTLYIDISETLGLPKPLDLNIPLFNKYSISSSSVLPEAYTYDEDRIYVLLKSDDDVIRYYTFNFNLDIIKIISESIKKHERLKFVETDSYYGTQKNGVYTTLVPDVIRNRDSKTYENFGDHQINMHNEGDDAR